LREEHLPIPAYTKPLQITHRDAIDCRVPGPHLYYQEKVDGSQFSFRLNETGTLEFRSRRIPIDPEAPGMFAAGVAAVRERADRLVPGYIYRGEYLSKPKHNVIKYDRVPLGHIALFDIEDRNGLWAAPWEVAVIAFLLGFDFVPTWQHDGPALNEWLEKESFLGGDIAEGYVIKNYSLPGRNTRPRVAKVVRPSFTEVHSSAKPKTFPRPDAALDTIIADYKTEARWQKAVQHLREEGQLENTNKDIGPLLQEVNQDIEAECEEDIKERLWQAYRKKILKGCCEGFQQWYQGQLLASLED
jgi:hypothetical protein